MYSLPYTVDTGAVIDSLAQAQAKLVVFEKTFYLGTIRAQFGHGWVQMTRVGLLHAARSKRCACEAEMRVRVRSLPTMSAGHRGVVLRAHARDHHEDQRRRHGGEDDF